MWPTGVLGSLGWQEREGTLPETGKKARVCGLHALFPEDLRPSLLPFLAAFVALEPGAVPGTWSLGSGESGCGMLHKLGRGNILHSL